MSSRTALIVSSTKTPGTQGRGVRHRRTPIGRPGLGLLIGAALIAGTLAVVPAATSAAETAGNADALQARARAELAVFTDWLNANGVKGYIGEVGWPNDVDTDKWNALARSWYGDAAGAGLWTSAWATGEWWGTTYNLSNYVWATAYGPLGATRPAAAVLEEQALAENRSVSLAGAEFGPIGIALMPTSTLSNANLGVYGRDYHYDRQESFNYLVSRGVTTVRLAFRWERIQPILGAALDPIELQRLTDAVARAQAAGLKVILDVHNYATTPPTGFSTARAECARPSARRSFPRAISPTFGAASAPSSGTTRASWAYGLMNEPVGMAAANGFSAAQLWEQASQAALNAIRANGDTKVVMCPVISGRESSSGPASTRRPGSPIRQATTAMRLITTGTATTRARTPRAIRTR